MNDQQRGVGEVSLYIQVMCLNKSSSHVNFASAAVLIIRGLDVIKALGFIRFFFIKCVCVIQKR